MYSFPGIFFNKIEHTFQWEYFRPRSSILQGGNRVWNIFTTKFQGRIRPKNGDILRNGFYQRIPLSVFTPIYWFHDKDVLFTGIIRVKSNLPIPNVTESNICGIPVGSGDKQMDNFRNTLNRYCNNHRITSYRECLIDNEWYLL